MPSRLRSRLASSTSWPARCSAARMSRATCAIARRHRMGRRLQRRVEGDPHGRACLSEARRRREAEALGEQGDAGSHVELAPYQLVAGRAEPRALGGIADQLREGVRQRFHVAGRDQATLRAIARSARRSPAARVATHRQALALRLHQHVGQAVAVAVGGDAARQHEQVGARASASSTALLRLRRRASRCGSAMPSARRLRAFSSRRAGRRRYGRGASAALGGSRASAASSTSIALLLDRRGRPQMSRTGSPPCGCRRAPASHAGRRREAGEIEAVIDELHARRRRAPARARCSAPMRVQVTQPGKLGELLALLPVGRGPDVLGVRRAAPGQAGMQRGVARRPRPGVCRKCACSRATSRRQFGAPAPAPGRSGGCGWAVGSRRRSASQAARARAIARQAPRLPPGPQHAQRLVVRYSGR